MDNKKIAKELLRIAKELEADYKYDPDHKYKPSGGHWQKTEKGWSTDGREPKKRNLIQKMNDRITNKIDKGMEKFQNGLEDKIKSWTNGFQNGVTDSMKQKKVNSMIARELLKIANMLRNADVITSATSYDEYMKGLKNKNNSKFKNEQSYNKAMGIEKSNKSKTVPKGLKNWVKDYQTARGTGNVGLAKQIKNNIDKEIKKHKLNKKDVYGEDKKVKKSGKPSRLLNDFFGESKHGKAIDKVLKGKWNESKVEKYINKLDDGTPRAVRMMEGIDKSLQMDVKKYDDKPMGVFTKALVKKIGESYKGWDK